MRYGVRTRVDDNGALIHTRRNGFLAPNAPSHAARRSPLPLITGIVSLSTSLTMMARSCPHFRRAQCRALHVLSISIFCKKWCTSPSFLKKYANENVSSCVVRSFLRVATWRPARIVSRCGKNCKLLKYHLHSMHDFSTKQMDIDDAQVLSCKCYSGLGHEVAANIRLDACRWVFSICVFGFSLFVCFGHRLRIEVTFLSLLLPLLLVPLLEHDQLGKI